MNNPAEIASKKTLEEIFKVLDEKKCFRVEAGAGAGKTYSLIKALERIIEIQSIKFQKDNKRIACITYTNVATSEINSRIDNNPIVFVETIHAFSWSLIKNFQKQMRDFIPLISGKWATRIEEAGGLKKQIVIYDLGYPKATEKEFYLHHDDVIKIITHFLSNEKFITLLRSKFPIILIDEYQDTDKALATAIIENLIDSPKGIQIGLFGDHWQKIYDKGYGLMASTNIVEIGKNANFRSEKRIVEMLNRIRPELTQKERDPLSGGQIKVFHTNTWAGNRRTENHWQGDLPPEIAHDYLKEVIKILAEQGWEFTPDSTKILMLTNNVLAKEQGYFNIANHFSDTDDYLKKNNNYIKFFVEILEPVLFFFEEKKYGEMFKALGGKTPRLRNQSEKIQWNIDLSSLNVIRLNKTIGDVIEHLKGTQKPRLSAKIEESEDKYERLKDLTEFEDEKDRVFVEKINAFKLIKYSEIIEVAKYIEDKTPFSTKHGVKGAEFENVLVICGRGWNNYNWNNFLTWADSGIPASKEDSFERNRNLFYVVCSRPKKRLAILFTQELSESAFNTLNRWFISDNIESI